MRFRFFELYCPNIFLMPKISHNSLWFISTTWNKANSTLLRLALGPKLHILGQISDQILIFCYKKLMHAFARSCMNFFKVNPYFSVNLGDKKCRAGPGQPYIMCRKCMFSVITWFLGWNWIFSIFSAIQHGKRVLHAFLDLVASHSLG